METKEKRIEQLAAVIEQYKDLTQMVNKPMIDRNGNSYGCHYAAIVDSESLAAALIEEGFGNLREFKQEIISRYLKGDIAGLLALLQEENTFE